MYPVTSTMRIPLKVTVKLTRRAFTTKGLKQKTSWARHTITMYPTRAEPNTITQPAPTTCLAYGNVFGEQMIALFSQY